ncbi:MAG: hypothetical protein ACM3NN_12100 [Nitrospirota bacterium]
MKGAVAFLSFALGIFASVCLGDSPQRGPIGVLRNGESPIEKGGLNFAVGERGLTALSFNGQPLVTLAERGELRPWKSRLRQAFEWLFPQSLAPVTTAKKEANSIESAFPWGRVFCSYTKRDDQLVMRIEVSNTGAQSVDELSLRLMELNFPSIPRGGTLEAGMFGFGFKGPDWRLQEGPLSIPSVADPRFVVPIITLDYGTGTLNFCSDDVDCAVDVPSSTNFPARTSYPLVATCRDIPPGVTKTFNISLRFGPEGARVQDLSGDVLQRYAKKYPFSVDWKNHRPIGAIFLAGPQINVATNPRRWTMNSGEIDVTNDEGKAAFRTALMKVADNAIQVLKDSGAQGMITWDPEGEEFPGACYYGDPRLVPKFAPEMEFTVDGGKSAIDEYFEKFRAAGLKVGICIRPEDVAMIDGKPVHQASNDEQAVRILRDKIGYAKRRWSCTLFYVDSTATAGRSFYPDVFKTVAQSYPDVLLIPENESMRYFAYSAPLNSYVHHKITSTPVGARLVYPKAFSVLMAADGDQPEDHAALLDAVRHGDILLFNAWYHNTGAERVKKLYAEAEAQHTDGH